MSYNSHEYKVSRKELIVGLFVIVLGVLMSAIDSTIVILALPVMMKDLRANIVEMVWVILIYILVVTVLSTQLGRMGDKYGRVRFYNLGFLIFTVGSGLSAASINAYMLLAFRAIQALGGGLISSNSGAVIADLLPPNRRGQAYGYTALGWNVGAILGILLGGIIVTYVSWRYIFLINVPIGIVATYIGYMYLKERSPKLVKRLDIRGSALLGGSLTFLLVGLTEAVGTRLNPFTESIIAAGLILLAAFAYHEMKFSDPIINMTLLKNRVLSGSIMAAFLQALANYSVLFLVIMYLQGVRGLTPFNASLLVVPGYILGGVLGPFMGRISDRIGARIPASLGLLAQSIGIFTYSFLTLNSPMWIITLAASINGIGSGMFYPANNSAVMANAPREHYGAASGTLRMFANIGMVISFAISLYIASLSMPAYLAQEIFLGTSVLNSSFGYAFTKGIETSFRFSVILMLLAIVFSLLRGKENREK
ncbi:MAG: MFS transporter [Nitrososphaeria archaeon]|nr:MFS transporter [Conexivisphaerales archaeon]